MRPTDDPAGPARPEPRPLPDCLTRLLHPQGLDAGYIVQPAGCARGGPKNNKKRTYARALASIWLDLDRLDELINLMVNADRHA